MKTVYHFKSDLPYSLHDCTVCKFALANGHVRLHFQDGMLSLSQPLAYREEGTLTFQQVNPEFSEVLLLSPMGQMGSFTGEKMSLKDFADAYGDFLFEVVDEFYSWHQALYSGFLMRPDRTEMREMSLHIYYEGDLVFLTES